jgi:hypothetical protein
METAQEATMFSTDVELQGPELWRRQCARNLMDCYALGMELLMTHPGERSADALTRLMVDGMTSVRESDDERAFYKTVAGLCRECAKAGEAKAGMFRIYAAIFEDMSVREGSHE